MKQLFQIVRVRVCPCERAFAHTYILLVGDIKCLFVVHKRKAWEAWMSVLSLSFLKLPFSYSRPLQKDTRHPGIHVGGNGGVFSKD